MAYHPLQRPTNLTGLLDAGFSLYTETFKTIIPLSFVFAVFYLLPEVIFPAQFVQLENGGAIVEQTGGAAANLLRIASAVVWIFIYAMMSYMLLEAGEKQAVMYRLAWRKVLENWLSLLITSLIYFVMILLGSIVVLPAFYVLVVFMFAIYYVVRDDEGPFGALKHSFHLVQGSWWHSFGLIVIPILFGLSAFIVLVNLFEIDIQIGQLYSGPPPASLYVLVFALIVFVLPLVGTIQMVLYRDLELRKTEFNIDEF